MKLGLQDYTLFIALLPLIFYGCTSSTQMHSDTNQSGTGSRTSETHNMEFGDMPEPGFGIVGVNLTQTPGEYLKELITNRYVLENKLEEGVAITLKHIPATERALSKASTSTGYDEKMYQDALLYFQDEITFEIIVFDANKYLDSLLGSAGNQRITIGEDYNDLSYYFKYSLENNVQFSREGTIYPLSLYHVMQANKLERTYKIILSFDVGNLEESVHQAKPGAIHVAIGSIITEFQIPNQLLETNTTLIF